jgi:hypothetical protein
MQGGRPGRYGLGADAPEMVEKRRAFQQLGVDTVEVSPYTGEVQEMARALEILARDVIPALPAGSVTCRYPGLTRPDNALHRPRRPPPHPPGAACLWLCRTHNLGLLLRLWEMVR